MKASCMPTLGILGHVTMTQENEKRPFLCQKFINLLIAQKPQNVEF